MNNLSYSKSGEQLTEGFEGCHLQAYQDVAGVWTIGYGTTGRDVVAGLVITQEDAVARLERGIAWAVHAVNSLVTVPLTQPEFDALVDFVYNAGAEAFHGSTMLRLLNAGDYHGAAGQFERWDHAGGKEVAGLLRRRKAEEAEFESGIV